MIFSILKTKVRPITMKSYESVNTGYRTKSKATTGVKNTASYIPWLFATWDQMVASNMIYCVLVLMTIATSLLCQVQTMLVYYLKANHPHIIKKYRHHSQEYFF